MAARQPATVVFGKQLVLRQDILFERDRGAVGCRGKRHFGERYGQVFGARVLRVIEGRRRSCLTAFINVLAAIVLMDVFMTVHVTVVFVFVSISMSFMSVPMRACMQM